MGCNPTCHVPCTAIADLDSVGIKVPVPLRVLIDLGDNRMDMPVACKCSVCISGDEGTGIFGGEYPKF